VSEHLTRHRLAELYDEAAQDLLGVGNADCPSEDSNPPELENNNTDDDDEIVLRPCSLNDFREIAEALLQATQETQGGSGSRRVQTHFRPWQGMGIASMRFQTASGYSCMQQ
jgi:hypothetical protein